MANHKGSEGVVHVGTSAVAELRGWETNEAAQTIDDTILSDTWESHALGTKSWTGNCNALLDETDANGQGALVIGSSVTVKFYMEGVGTGATYKYGTATVTGVADSGALNGMVERRMELKGNGALTQTTA